VALGEAGDVRAVLDRAVVIDQLGEDADRAQPASGKDRPRPRYGRSHEHAAIACDQREDVAGAHEVGGAGIGVGEARTVLQRSSAEMPVVSRGGNRPTR
jgi:hypothetical protein